MNKSGRHFIKFSGNFLLMLLMFVICLIIVFAIGDLVFEDQNFTIDQKVSADIAPLINSTNTGFFQTITFFGGANFILPAYLILIAVFLLLKEHRHFAWKIGVVATMGSVIMFGLKDFFQRQRPLVPLISKAHGYSFPSGHSFSAVLLYGTIAYIVYKTNLPTWLKSSIILLLIVFIFLIGISRIYLNVHYATDVAAGWLLGLMWLLLAKYFLIDRRKNLPFDNTRVLQ